MFLFELLFADLPFFAGVVAGELFLFEELKNLFFEYFLWVVAGELFLFEELLLPELLLLVLLLFAV